MLEWPSLPEIVMSTKDVCDSFLRTMQVRVELLWALLKAVWRGISSKKLKGNTQFFRADEEISSDHQMRDA